MGSVIGVPLAVLVRPELLFAGDETRAAPAGAFAPARYTGIWDVAWRTRSLFEDGVSAGAAIGDQIAYDSCATYTLEDGADGPAPGALRLGIVNSQLYPNSDAVHTMIRGTATQTSTHALEFKVEFDQGLIRHSGVYKILAFGFWDAQRPPVSVELLPYDWAIVSGNDDAHVWVLARSIEEAVGLENGKTLRAQLADLGLEGVHLEATPSMRLHSDAFNAAEAEGGEPHDEEW